MKTFQLKQSAFEVQNLLNKINSIDIERINNNFQELQEGLNNLQEGLNSLQENSSKIYIGEFNAGLLTKEGWYDSITLGRPEGSESDEKYFLYQSSKGGQICFSRRNSGKAYHRLGKNHPWVALTHDDYGLQQAACAALNNYNKNQDVPYDKWTWNSSAGLRIDNNTRLAEVYSGNELEVTTIDVYKSLEIHPNDIIKVRALYRRGFSREGIETYPYDSDAYIYVSNQPQAGHDLAHLKSDFIKVRSLGSLDFQFTEEQKNWQDLAFVRDNLFRDNTEYGWHYIKVNVPTFGLYYLHIAGNFSTAGSWFVFGEAEVWTKGSATSFPSNPINTEDANAAITTGFYGYITNHTPADAAGWGNLAVRRADSPDASGYTSIEQIFYGRSPSDVGHFWRRLCFEYNGQIQTEPWSKRI